MLHSKNRFYPFSNFFFRSLFIFLPSSQALSVVEGKLNVKMLAECRARNDTIASRTCDKIQTQMNEEVKRQETES